VNLVHLFDPSRVNEAARMKIHYQSIDGRTLMCGLGLVFREADGERFRIWHPTKRPVTCTSCTKRIEALVRFQIADLTAEQLEELLAHIESFRSPPEGAESPENPGK